MVCEDRNFGSSRACQYYVVRFPYDEWPWETQKADPNPEEFSGFRLFFQPASLFLSPTSPLSTSPLPAGSNAEGEP